MKSNDWLFSFAIGFCFGVGFAGLVAATVAKVQREAIRQYKYQSMASQDDCHTNRDLRIEPRNSK